MKFDIKRVHNISRPGQPPEVGDVVEIECTNGFIREVDPTTRQCRDAHQRFQIAEGGELTPVHA